MPGGYNDPMPGKPIHPEASDRATVQADLSDLPDDGCVGWVLYDDNCGFCRKWVPMFGNTLARRSIGTAPNQRPWALRALGLEPGQTPGDICLLLRDGRRILGADAYRCAMWRIWWAYPLYLLSILPVLHGLFDFVYRAFARNRYRFSKACGLPGAGEGGAQQAGRP
jgi:predicted DCC family thiol-disulfide oxidoreductase YuxK